MIDQFTKNDFETFLESHSPFTPLGLVDGEETYILPLDNQVSITIRSSIKSDGLSANVGKDSIRCWLMNGDKPLGSKVSKWTTRQPGWQERLTKNINQLVLWRTLAGDCKECNKPKGIFKARTEANKGRPFARCREHNNFVWLDKPIKVSDIYFSEESKKKYPELEKFNWWHNQETSEESHDIGKELGAASVSRESQGGGHKDALQFGDVDTKCKNADESEGSIKDLQELPSEDECYEIIAKALGTTPDDIEIEPYRISEESKSDNNANVGQERSEMACSKARDRDITNKKCSNDMRIKDTEPKECIEFPEVGDKRGHLQALPSGPNPAQREAIEASVNSDLRVLAGPGSGKTYVIEHRYKFLVDNGVNPRNIIVCTFGKQAATEMGQRILKTCPTANIEQICTINALCYRLLAKWYPDSRWYKWQGPKDWQIKKCLQDAIGVVWREKEKPSAQEVYDKINTSKYLGLTVDDSYEFFTANLGIEYGEWLYDIRSKFDAWLNRSRFLTFADQLYLVEMRLQSDEAWRMMLQEKFGHVIVDEGQDTNLIAMRILVTLSLEPGKNTVYESEAK